MAQAKKHYKVDVYIYGESAFTPFRKLRILYCGQSQLA